MLRVACLLAGPAVCLLVAPLAGAEPADAALRKGIAQLLEQGWPLSAQARAEAKTQFEQLNTSAPDDPSLCYAYALVQLRQQQHKQAAELLDGILKADKEHLAAWRARAWLLMLQRRPDAALVAMDQLSRLLPQAAAQDPPSELELARFLGRMFGFLEGPARSDQVDSLRAPHERTVLDRLDPPQRDAFQQARQEVRDKFQQLAAGNQQDRAQAQQQWAEHAERVGKQLEQERQQLNAQSEAARQRRDDAQSQLQSALGEIATADQPLVASLATIERQASAVKREVVLLEDEIVLLSNRLARARDPHEIAHLRLEIERLEIIQSRYWGDLSLLERDASPLLAQRAVLERRAADAQARFQQQIRDAEQLLAQLVQRARRIDMDQRQLARRDGSLPPGIRGRETQMTALTTYEPFPLEAEKQRLLESLERP